MTKSNESVTRSLIKTVTYRVIIIVSTYVISYWLTGNITLSLEITSISALANTLLYYMHERVWNAIKWGRHK